VVVAILHDTALPLPPYPSWLSECDDDLVLITGHGAAALAVGTAGRMAVRACADYRGSAEAERHVLDLAESAPLTALVAASDTDMIRAGALRDYLGLPGQRRDNAIRCRDLSLMRAHLAAMGLAALPAAPVEQVCQLYQAAAEWGYPFLLRRRRTHGWPVVTVLHDEAGLRRFSVGGLTSQYGLVPSLVAEPCVTGVASHILAATAADGSRAFSLGGAAGPSAATRQRAMTVMAALEVPDRYPVVLIMRDVAGAGPLVDSAMCGFVGPLWAGHFRAAFGADPLREVVRAQAGLARTGQPGGSREAPG
jgi:hypothetical protein